MIDDVQKGPDAENIRAEDEGRSKEREPNPNAPADRDHAPAASLYPVGPLRASADLKLWVAWQGEKAEDGKLVKPPYNPNRTDLYQNSRSPDPKIRDRVKAKVSDSKTWVTLALAREAAAKLPKPLGTGGVGIMLGNSLLGFDLDTCLDPESGRVEWWAELLIKRLNTYTEVSPSKTGFKSFAFVDEKTRIPGMTTFAMRTGAHPPGIQILYGGHYSTVTGEQYGDCTKIRTISADELETILELCRSIFGDAKNRGGLDQHLDDFELMRRALPFIRDTDNQNWANIGYALKGTFDDRAFEPWSDWLRQLDPDAWDRRNREVPMRKKWESFKPRGKDSGGIGLGSIFKQAMDNGWVMPKRGGQGDGVEVDISDDVDEEPLPPAPDWPAPMDMAAFHGIAGDIVKALRPHTEVNAENLLVHLLVGLGNMLGHGPYFELGGETHHLNLFAMVVGDTGEGKGTGWKLVRRVLQDIDHEWCIFKTGSGASSAEGVIERVRDPSEKLDAEGKPFDEGVIDKRYLFAEQEFSGGVLQVMKRSGNKLSEILRLAWDGEVLQSITRTLGKNSTSGQTATNAHVSLFGHTTRAELLRNAEAVDTENGFLNRFLFAAVVMDNELEEFSPSYSDELRALVKPYIDKLERLRIKLLGDENKHDPTIGPPPLLIPWDEQARRRCVELRKEYRASKRSMTARSMPQIMRLALLYAVLDDDFRIRTTHLDAAVAVVRYSEATLHYIFGDAPGNRLAASVLSELRHAGSKGRSRTELMRSTKSLAADLDQAVYALHDAGRIRWEKVEPKVTGKRKGGRKSTKWFIVKDAKS